MRAGTRQRDYEAIVAIYEREGRVTVRALQRELGLSSAGRLIDRLRQLRDEGLIAYDDHRAATIRPLLQLDDRVAATEAQRPGETVSDWCRRLDSYANAPSPAVLVVGADVETFDSVEEMVRVWQELGRPDAVMLKVEAA